MSIKYTYKFRLYPNDTQKELLSKHFGCTRYLYNHFLSKRKEQYLNTKRSNNYYEDCKELTELKKELGWLKEVNSQSLQYAVKSLQIAYDNFFAKRAKFPKFKKKHYRQSFRVPQSVKLENEKLIIPKFREGIQCKIHREIVGNINFCTVTKNSCGQYYCSLTVERDIAPLQGKSNIIGIDLGVKNLVVDSNGTEYKNIKPYKRLSKKLKCLQRQYNKRRNKNSRRTEKVRKKLAKIHQKVKNVRIDYIHKTTRKLINENQVIVVESLDVKGMMKNRILAGSIGDCAWGEVVRQLIYKAGWYGRKIINIDRFFPSSKTCHICGYIKQDLKLKDRNWTCPSCNSYHDRDINAAKMILQQGQNQIRSERPEFKLADSTSDLSDS